VALGLAVLAAVPVVAWARSWTTVSRSDNSLTVQGSQPDLVDLGHLDGGSYRLTLSDIGCHMSASLQNWSPPRKAYPEPHVYIGAMTPWRVGSELDQERSSAPAVGAIVGGQYNLSVGYLICSCLGVGVSHEHSQPCRWRAILTRVAA